MRFCDLLEAKVYNTPSFRLFKNPNSQELKDIVQNNDFRGLLYDDEVFIWYAWDATHNDIIKWVEQNLLKPRLSDAKFEFSLNSKQNIIHIMGIYINDLIDNTSFNRMVKGWNLNQSFLESITEGKVMKIEGHNGSNYKVLVNPTQQQVINLWAVLKQTARRGQGGPTIRWIDWEDILYIWSGYHEEHLTMFEKLTDEDFDDPDNYGDIKAGYIWYAKNKLVYSQNYGEEFESVISRTRIPIATPNDYDYFD